MIEMQNQIAKFIEPFVDFQKRFSDMLAPLTKVSAQIKAIAKLGENQLIWFYVLDENIVNKLLSSYKIDGLMSDYLEGSKYYEINEIIKVSRKSSFLEEKKLIYSQTISAYRNKHYHLACLGFISIIDFLLSKISGENGTRFLDKVEIVVRKMKSREVLEEFENEYFYIYLSIDKVLNSLFEFSDFSGDEPLIINRHWIAHGRTKKKYSKLDCVKLINLIYALLLIGSFKDSGET